MNMAKARYNNHHNNLFKSFHTNAAGNDPQWQIWPKTWLRLGQNGHFCIFFYLFPQNEVEIDSEWSISPDSQLFPSFATKASHFWRNLQNFHFWGRGTLANFLTFPTFSNRFTPIQLKITHNGKFGQKSGLDWVKMAIFAYFSIFSPKWGWDWLGMVNFTWFTTFPIFCHQSISFLEKSQKFSFLGGYIGKFFEFSNFFKSFHTKTAGNHPQWQIWPKKWLRLSQNGHFCIFFYLFPQNEAEIDSEWSISPDSQLFPSFATKASHFWRNSKYFYFSGGRGGGYIGRFFEFFNFFKLFYTNAAENDPQWQIWPKKWLRLSQNGHFCIFFYLFPQNEVEIDSEWSISPDSQLFPSFATKASHFWRNLKNFHFWGGGCQIQWEWFQVSTISSFWEIRVLGVKKGEK